MFRSAEDDAGARAAWQDLCHRTRRAAMFMQYVRIRPSPGGGMEAGPGWYPLVGAILLFMLAGFCGWGAWMTWRMFRDAPFFIPSAIICSILCLGLVFILVMALLNQPRVLWRMGRDELHIRFGYFPWIRTLSLRRSSVEARLETQTATAEHQEWRGVEHSAVLLRWSEAGDSQVKVFTGIHARAKRLYDELSRFLGGERVQDDTVIKLGVPGGRSIDVCKAPISESGGGGVTAVLRFPSPDRAVLKPSIEVRVFFAFVFLVGLGILVFGVPGAIRTRAVIPIALTLILGPLFALPGLYVMFFGLGPARATFDRKSGRISIRWAVARREIAIADVAALQMVSKFNRDTESPSTYYELNLVLLDPPGDRVNLMAHGTERRVREDARALAEFLGRPLLDHTV